MRTYGPSGGYGTELEHAFEWRIVPADLDYESIKSMHREWRGPISRTIERELPRGFGGDPAQELHVFVRVKRAHVLRRTAWRSLAGLMPESRSGRGTARGEDAYKGLHLVEHAVRGDEVVGHSHAMRLHGMSCSVRVRADVRWCPP